VAAAAFWVGPADHDKFFAVEALGLQPGAPLGLVSTVDPFRDNAFQTVFARQLMKMRDLGRPGDRCI
jgi:hypothetical protein